MMCTGNTECGNALQADESLGNVFSPPSQGARSLTLYQYTNRDMNATISQPVDCTICLRICPTGFHARLLPKGPMEIFAPSDHGFEHHGMLATNFMTADESAQSSFTNPLGVSPFAGPAALPASSAWTDAVAPLAPPHLAAYASEPVNVPQSLRAASLPATAIHKRSKCTLKPMRRQHPAMMASSLNSMSLPTAQQYADAVNHAEMLKVEVCAVLSPRVSTSVDRRVLPQQNEVLQTCLRSMLHKLHAKESECRALRTHLEQLCGTR